MKINQIIKEQRKKLGFTQSQVAEYLGVSTPAVSKWESGSSYPDITQVPALARLLCVDLNTLLSFNEELTEEEIGEFIKELEKTIGEQGFAKGFGMAMEKLQEFPNCNKLICVTAMTLDGMSQVFGGDDCQQYGEKIQELYERLTDSKDIKLRNQALTIMIHKHIHKGQYEKAQMLLDGIEETHFDKRQLQASLYAGEGRLDDAAKILEEKLMIRAGEIQQVLMHMLDFAIKDNRLEDAQIYVEKNEKITDILELWKYTGFAPGLQLAIATKDKGSAITILKAMFTSIDKKWEINESPLYRHIQQKEGSQQSYEQMKKILIAGLGGDEELDFLRDEPELQELLAGHEKR